MRFKEYIVGIYWSTLSSPSSGYRDRPWRHEEYLRRVQLLEYHVIYVQRSLAIFNENQLQAELSHARSRGQEFMSSANPDSATMRAIFQSAIVVSHHDFPKSKQLLFLAV